MGVKMFIMTEVCQEEDKTMMGSFFFTANPIAILDPGSWWSRGMALNR